MLIQFNVGNYRSFKEKVTLNLEASVAKEIDKNTFVVSDDLKLLKSAIIYGPNASGKSNLFSALMFMHQFIINSSNAQITSKIPVEPFRLSTETEHEPSYFEIVFIYENVRYRYGFTVNSEKVCSEWFFSYPKGKPIKLFIRESNKFDINKNKFSEGKKDLIDKTRQNALFLSTVAQFNGEISRKVLGWINTLNIISGLTELGYMNFSINKITDESFKKQILEFIHSADIDIDDFLAEPINFPPQNIPPGISINMSGGIKINTLHKKYDKSNRVDSQVAFELGIHESAGTNKLFMLSAPILDTLINGKTLFVDEIDSRLHPLIMKFIIELFNSKEKNPKNAQLIFNAHSTLLLGHEQFRRDQIWFVQKDRYGVSELFSLDDYSVRKDSSFEKDYLLGKYGGIPIINNYEAEKAKD